MASVKMEEGKIAEGEASISRQSSVELAVGGVDLGAVPADEEPNFQSLLEANLEKEFEGKHASAVGIIASVIGNALEFFDFSVYAFFAPEIGQLFFPKGSAVLQAVQTFSVFGAGFMMRPLGSMLLGAIGDHYGTAVALRWSIALMSIPTVLTGCLPTIHQIGPAATGLLTVLRLLQGLSVGGEYVGAILHTADTVEGAKRRALYGGLIASMCVLGNLLGSSVSVIVHAALPQKKVLSWGWRVPFICGALLGVVGIMLRSKKTDEEKAAGAAHHQHHQPQKTRMQKLLETAKNIRKDDIPQLLLFFVLSAMVNLVFYTNIAWIGTYLAKLSPKPLPPIQAFSAVCVLQSLAVVSMPFFGYLGDISKGWMNWHAAGTLAFMIAQPLLFLLLQSGSVMHAYIYAIIMGPMVGFAYSGNFWAWITQELGTAPSRYFAMGISYNLGAMIGG